MFINSLSGCFLYLLPLNNSHKAHMFSETNCPSIKWQKKLTVSCPKGLVYGQSCSFTCDPGYDLIGDGVTICVRNDSVPSMGFWSNEPPICDGKLAFELLSNVEQK